jgi:hypothetical protein
MAQPYCDITHNHIHMKLIFFCEKLMFIISYWHVMCLRLLERTAKLIEHRIKNKYNKCITFHIPLCKANADTIYVIAQNSCYTITFVTYYVNEKLQSICAYANDNDAKGYMFYKYSDGSFRYTSRGRAYKMPLIVQRVVQDRSLRALRQITN